MNTVTTISVYDSLKEIMSTDTLSDLLMSEMESLYDYCHVGMESDSEKFLSVLYLNALNRKLNADAFNENTYEKKYEVSQIELFNILIDKFPFVKYSQQIINAAIVKILKQNEEATIIDIGCGLGTQMANIISMLKDCGNLKKLIIVGLEPFTEALAIAEEKINALRSTVDFEMEFVAVNQFAEQTDFSALTCLRGRVVVNASLALHHIQSNDMRKATLESIKSINPFAVILTEPNVNHFEPDTVLRFQHSYNHFNCLFSVIDKLDIEQQYKSALKLFFGREIEDIFGKPEDVRFEKHAPATHWIELLRNTGFDIANGMLEMPITSQPDVEINYLSEGFVGFTHHDETALALIYAY